MLVEDRLDGRVKERNCSTFGRDLGIGDGHDFAFKWIQQPSQATLVGRRPCFMHKDRLQGKLLVFVDHDRNGFLRAGLESLRVHE